MGTIPLPQPTLPTPYMLQQNPQPNIRPHLPAQPNPNPNNRPIQSIQIIEGLNLEIDMRECNELKLSFGCVISPDKDKNLQPKVKETYLNKPSTIDDQQIKHGGDIVRQKDLEKVIITSPMFPERLIIP